MAGVQQSVQFEQFAVRFRRSAPPIVPCIPPLPHWFAPGSQLGPLRLLPFPRFLCVRWLCPLPSCCACRSTCSFDGGRKVPPGRLSFSAGSCLMWHAFFGHTKSLEHMSAPSFRFAVYSRCLRLGWLSPAASGLNWGVLASVRTAAIVAREGLSAEIAARGASPTWRCIAPKTCASPPFVASAARVGPSLATWCSRDAWLRSLDWGRVSRFLSSLPPFDVR